MVVRATSIRSLHLILLSQTAQRSTTIAQASHLNSDCSLLFDACFDAPAERGGITGVGVINGPPVSPEFAETLNGPFNVTIDTGVVRINPGMPGTDYATGLLGRLYFCGYGGADHHEHLPAAVLVRDPASKLF